MLSFLLALIKLALAALAFNLASSSKASEIIIKMPVQWEITRNEFKDDGTATLTESFREVWTIGINSPFSSYISSPRGKVAVSGISPHRIDSKGNFPQFLIVGEREFKKLIGLVSNEHQSQPPSNLASLLTIPLKSPAMVLDDFTFHQVGGYSYTIRLFFSL